MRLWYSVFCFLSGPCALKLSRMCNLLSLIREKTPPQKGDYMDYLVKIKVLGGLLLSAAVFGIHFKVGLEYLSELESYMWQGNKNAIQVVIICKGRPLCLLVCCATRGCRKHFT
ncbi:hypothetical protein KIL84_013308 [Mauremys mutica]|uniref:Uncharacterized protein n=1 Tax=Mauremys mutica TaxID=74926 RepID=A0A9D4ARZ7_9SAUR|nr:hypothetical protein KIL84_013308 [Mauremys mutica]